jgi:hypothetical protein
MVVEDPQQEPTGADCAEKKAAQNSGHPLPPVPPPNPPPSAPSRCGCDNDPYEQKNYRLNKRQFIVALITLFVLSIYTAVAAYQAYQMRKATKATQVAAHAAESAANTADATLKVSQGAYVTIGRKDGVVAEFVMPKDPKQNAGILIYFQNSGHLAAKFNWGIEIMNLFPPIPGFLLPLSPHDFNHMTRTRNRKDGSTGETGGQTIAGDSLFVTDIVELPRNQAITISRSHRLFMINGVFEYCDALGTYTCRQFMVFHQGDPYNRFSYGSDFECPVHLTRVIKPDPNLEYLSPCKTRAEEQQQKVQPQ